MNSITKRINVIKGLSILMVVASHLAPNISRGGGTSDFCYL